MQRKCPGFDCYPEVVSQDVLVLRKYRLRRLGIKGQDVYINSHVTGGRKGNEKVSVSPSLSGPIQELSDSVSLKSHRNKHWETWARLL